jgi:NAD(P)-dependent dehydrogenase (short-subunit alcohol dehydrogenase family)
MWIRYGPISSIDEETLDGMLAIGLKGVIWAIQRAEPAMAARGGGSIINMCSPVAEIGLPFSAVYATVKGGIAALTRQAAVELAPKAIRVNAISPGPIRTPGTEAILDEEGWKARAARTPLGHLGEPHDIGSVAAFLASQRSRFITGVTLRVDGGLTVSAG